MLWASLAQMDSQALLACLDQLDPLGTGDSQEKSWGPSPGPGEMLDSLDTRG